MNRSTGFEPGDLTRMRKAIARYQRPSTSRALWQLTNTLMPYALLWYAIHRAQAISLWLAIPLAVAAGALLVRAFIIFHDCGHGSFFGKPWANRLVGVVTGLLTFTPYHHWHRDHAIHHGASGHLDRRGTGDIWTLTVQEYLQASRWRRFCYRLARHPLVLFGVAPLVMFVLVQRIPSAGATPRARNSVWWTNVALLGCVAGMSLLYGPARYLLLQGIVLTVAGAIGVWLFYVQHQFEGAFWARGEGWSSVAAALQGSSYYKLPRVFQWLTGNIGFHHIHHLGPGVPNYHLQACHEAEAAFQRIKPVTLAGSIRALALRLWDESEQRLVGYATAARNAAKAAADAPLRQN